MTRRYADHDKVAFADINYSESRAGGSHRPGMGGWPTIKYFNDATGPDGAFYEKKTDKPVCDELNHDGMNAYVLAAGGIDAAAASREL